MMRILHFTLTFFLVTHALNAQYSPRKSYMKAYSPQSGVLASNHRPVKKNNIQFVKTTITSDTLFNIYGDLLNDSPEFNPKYVWWKPALEVTGNNVFTFAVDRYVAKFDYSTSVSRATWQYNIDHGWEWDRDGFGINFIGHPYSGSVSFNAARSSGYNYWQSFPYALGGSLMWEYFGENTLPSYNDLINTPINGAFLGEVLYRLSSNILDDRTRGSERVLREVAAGILNPMRGVNRLIQGKSFRVTKQEVYQKEPVNVSAYAGIRQVNSTAGVGPGSSNLNLNVQLDYGNAFEKVNRKPFDFFKLRTDLNFGVPKLLNSLTGYAILSGRNYESGKNAMLVGTFQFYDYMNNNTFELGTIGFGAGIISKQEFNDKTNLYSCIQFAAVPFGGNSTERGPIDAKVRDYNYGGGLQGRFESRILLWDRLSLAFRANYYWISTYVGAGGNSFTGLLQPKVTLRVYKNLNLGFEHQIYINDRYSERYHHNHLSRTEEKFFILLYFENSKRKGHYC